MEIKSITPRNSEAADSVAALKKRAGSGHGSPLDKALLVTEAADAQSFQSVYVRSRNNPGQTLD